MCILLGITVYIIPVSSTEGALSKKSPAVSEPRLWRKSTFHIRRGSKKGSSLTSLATPGQAEEPDSQGEQSEHFYLFCNNKPRQQRV